MINWDDHLIIEKKLQRRLGRIKRRLKKGKYCRNVFLITSPSNEANLYDIHEAKNFIFPYYHDKEITVYAVASSGDTAREQLLTLLEERYQSTGDHKDVADS